MAMDVNIHIAFVFWQLCAVNMLPSTRFHLRGGVGKFKSNNSMTETKSSSQHPVIPSGHAKVTSLVNNNSSIKANDTVVGTNNQVFEGNSKMCKGLEACFNTCVNITSHERFTCPDVVLNMNLKSNLTIEWCPSDAVICGLKKGKCVFECSNDNTPLPCIDDYYGYYDYRRFRNSSCCNNCYPTTCDNCDNCIRGYRGEYCNETCGDACNVGCFRDTGFCKLCPEGFYGFNCSFPCPEHCARSGCSPRDGSCSVCEPTSNLSECSVHCQEGYYSELCDLECPENCKDGTCDSVSGNCTRGCQSGYGGHICDTTCQNGTFGEDCIAQCPVTCLEGTTCNHETGSCDEGCSTGFSGEICDSVCSDSTFGPSCNQTCSLNCSQEGCNPFSGQCVSCPDGRDGAFCENEISGDAATLQTNTKMTMRTVLITVCSILGLGVGIWCLIGFATFFRNADAIKTVEKTGKPPKRFKFRPVVNGRLLGPHFQRECLMEPKRVRPRHHRDVAPAIIDSSIEQPVQWLKSRFRTMARKQERKHRRDEYEEDTFNDGAHDFPSFINELQSELSTPALTVQTPALTVQTVENEQKGQGRTHPRPLNPRRQTSRVKPKVAFMPQAAHTPSIVPDASMNGRPFFIPGVNVATETMKEEESSTHYTTSTDSDADSSTLTDDLDSSTSDDSSDSSDDSSDSDATSKASSSQSTTTTTAKGADNTSTEASTSVSTAVDTAHKSRDDSTDEDDDDDTTSATSKGSTSISTAEVKSEKKKDKRKLAKVREKEKRKLPTIREKGKRKLPTIREKEKIKLPTGKEKEIKQPPKARQKRRGSSVERKTKETPSKEKHNIEQMEAFYDLMKSKFLEEKAVGDTTQIPAKPSWQDLMVKIQLDNRNKKDHERKSFVTHLMELLDKSKFEWRKRDPRDDEMHDSGVIRGRGRDMYEPDDTTSHEGSNKPKPYQKRKAILINSRDDGTRDVEASRSADSLSRGSTPTFIDSSTRQSAIAMSMYKRPGYFVKPILKSYSKHVRYAEPEEAALANLHRAHSSSYVSSKDAQRSSGVSFDTARGLKPIVRGPSGNSSSFVSSTTKEPLRSSGVSFSPYDSERPTRSSGKGSSVNSSSFLTSTPRSSGVSFSPYDTERGWRSTGKESSTNFSSYGGTTSREAPQSSGVSLTSYDTERPSKSTLKESSAHSFSYVSSATKEAPPKSSVVSFSTQDVNLGPASSFSSSKYDGAPSSNTRSRDALQSLTLSSAQEKDGFSKSTTHKSSTSMSAYNDTAGTSNTRSKDRLKSSGSSSARDKERHSKHSAHRLSHSASVSEDNSASTKSKRSSDESSVREKDEGSRSSGHSHRSSRSVSISEEENSTNTDVTSSRVSSSARTVSSSTRGSPEGTTDQSSRSVKSTTATTSESPSTKSETASSDDSSENTDSDDTTVVETSHGTQRPFLFN